MSHYRFKGIFGILNITDDSFSDGGRYLRPDDALKKADELYRDGADIIDVGSVSSNPKGKDINSRMEINRILPLLEYCKDKKSTLSIDTFNPDTQRFFIEKNVGWINDIRGFEHPSAYNHLKHFSGRLILMHAVQNQGRADFSAVDPVQIMEKIMRFFDRRLNQLVRAGVSAQKIVLDPGMGFFLGIDPECSMTVLRQMDQLRSFNLDIMISVSKKSFLRKISGFDTDKLAGVNLCAEIMAVLGGARFIRTHTPKLLSDARIFMDCFFRPEKPHA